MQKDVFKIIALGLILIIMGFGITFLVKSDMLFSPKENTKITDSNNEEESKENEEQKENNESEDVKKEEENSNQEETTKQEETQTTTTNKSNSATNNNTTTNQNSSNKTTTTNNTTQTTTTTNNNSQSSSTNNSSSSTGGNNKEDNSSNNNEIEYVLLKKINCSGLVRTKEVDLTMKISAAFDPRDMYISTLEATYIYDYTYTYEEFDDETRTAQEKYLLETIRKSTVAGAFDYSSSSSGNIIVVYEKGTSATLRKAYPNEFTETGEYYYDNFLKEYSSLGFTCKTG